MISMIHSHRSRCHVERSETSQRCATQLADAWRAILLRQPKLITAVIAGAIGYGVMILVMTATPIAMHGHTHDFRNTASVIQWHVLGMFLPSFITGRLIARWGEITIIQVGCLLLALCVAVAQTGTGYWFYWWALVAFGVGWNFTFIGATYLVTHT